MGHNQLWTNAVEPATVLPGSAAELVSVLEQLTGTANRWSEVLDALRGPARNYGGAAAGVSFDVACRRAEQVFLQLEIALRDARADQPYR